MGAILGSALGGTVLLSFGLSGYFFALAIPLAIAWLCVIMIPKRSTVIV